MSVAGARAERLPVRTYTIADGLPRDGASRIVQDSRGFLWICTADGVSRFDGYGFTTFTVDDGLPERHVNDVLELDRETYFFATDGGLARLNPRGLRGSQDNPLFSVFAPAGGEARSFRAFLREGADSFLAASDAGLYRVRARGGEVTFERVAIDGPPAVRRPEVTALYRDSKGRVWAGSFGWIARIDAEGHAVTFGAEAGVPTAGVTSFLEDASGRILAGMRDFGGLLILDADRAAGERLVERIVLERDGLSSNWIADIDRASDGRMLLATAKGLCEWNDGPGPVCRRVYREENGLCDHTDAIHEDSDGNIWIASSCGVKRIARYGFTSFDERDGLGFAFPETLLETAAGDLVAASHSNGRWLSRFGGDKFEIIKLRDLAFGQNSHGWGWKQTALQDRFGDWWIASGAALIRYRGSKVFAELAAAAPEDAAPGVFRGEPFRIFEDSHGDIWVGTFGQPKYGLLRWRRSTGTWEDLTDAAGLTPVSLVSAFLQDRAGNLWIATGIDNGREAVLVRYRDGVFRTFTEKDGVPTGWMRDAYLDSKGQIWFANTTTGLLRLLDPDSQGSLEFARYGRAEGLASNGIYCVVEDNFGRLYAGSGRGVDRIDLESGAVRNFTTSDGLPANQVEVAFRDRHGDLWFSAQKGLARLRPEPLRERRPPTALITGIRSSNGQAQPISVLGEQSVPPVSLAAHDSVSVDFIGLGAGLGERLRYEYRLGENLAWNTTNERTINIADLAAGEFLLEVRALTFDGVTGAPANVEFRVAAPIWQRWWFITALAFAVGIAFYGFYRNRLARILQLERMRTRIATDLHDDIGANLTRISLLSEVARQRSANGSADLLESIADISRESVASMNDIVWAISPEHDRVVDLVRRMRSHAEEIFTLRDIDLEYFAPVSEEDLQLPVGVRRDVLLIFKEAVNNAARHSGCTRVVIRFEIEGDRLRLNVADNGRGFAPGSWPDGQGLRSMQRRADALGGRLDIASTSEKAGTTVSFEMELRRAPTI
ncbi:MAG: ATP-binding protein [Pyrinomonadaceae bacterium]